MMKIRAETEQRKKIEKKKLDFINLVCVWMCVLVAQSCPTLCNPMDCSLPGSSVRGIFRQEYWSGLPVPSHY